VGGVEGPWGEGGSLISAAALFLVEQCLGRYLQDEAAFAPCIALSLTILLFTMKSGRHSGARPEWHCERSRQGGELVVSGSPGLILSYQASLLHLPCDPSRTRPSLTIDARIHCIDNICRGERVWVMIHRMRGRTAALDLLQLPHRPKHKPHLVCWCSSQHSPPQETHTGWGG